MQTRHREQQRDHDPEEDGEADHTVAQRARMGRQFLGGLVDQGLFVNQGLLNWMLCLSGVIRVPGTVASKADPPSPSRKTQQQQQSILGRHRKWPNNNHESWSFDDEPAVQTALSRALKLERYEVAQAGDGREALERLGAMAYEVVILDVSMPHVRRAGGLPAAAGGRRPHARADADRARRG